VIYASAFSTSCFVLSATDGKTEQRTRNKFSVRLGKSATETLENLHEDGQLFLNGIHVSRTVGCQFKMTNVQRNPVPAKGQKIIETIEGSSMKIII
jgi:hypothetical protein